MLAGSQCFGTDDGVRVVGSTADNGVSLIQQLGIHLLVVVVELAVGVELLVLVQHALGILPVGIGQTDELYIVIQLVAVLAHAVDIGMSTSADAHAENLQLGLLRGGFLLGLCQHVGGSHCKCSRCCCSCLQKGTS